MAMGFGDEIRALRARSGLSQSEFGVKAGLHRNTISRIEGGKLTFDELDQGTRILLAVACGISVEELARLGKSSPSPPVANGRVAELLTGTIPPDLFARVELVAQARGRSWLEWLERVVANAEARIAAQQQPMGNPVYHKGDTAIELDPVPSQRRRRKADPTGGAHPPAPPSRRGRKP